MCVDVMLCRKVLVVPWNENLVFYKCFLPERRPGQVGLDCVTQCFCNWYLFERMKERVGRSSVDSKCDMCFLPG